MYTCFLVYFVCYRSGRNCWVLCLSLCHAASTCLWLFQQYTQNSLRIMTSGWTKGRTQVTVKTISRWLVLQRSGISDCQSFLDTACSSFVSLHSKAARVHCWRQWTFWWQSVLPEPTEIIMVALCNRADHCIFALWFLSSFFFFSSPNLSGQRLDVYHTSTHGVTLVRI